MDSTTGDFTELRRSSVENHVQRLTQSVVKRRSRIVRKNITLTPLNLIEIRKECEEADKLYEKELLNNLEVDKEPLVATDKTDTEVDVGIEKDAHLEVITNKSEPINCNSSNSPLIGELKRSKQENDSFDLNFSALSLVTPGKKTECTKVARTDIINSRNLGTKFDNFVTPNTDRGRPTKIQYSVSKSIIPGSGRRAPLVNSFQTPVIEGKNEDFLFQGNSENKVISMSSHFGTECAPLNVPPEYLMFEKLKVKDVEYLILNILGKGGSSEVFDCFCCKDKKHVAIKCVSLQNSVNAVGYINEVKLLQKLQNCEKIIKMYDYEVLENENKLLVVLEKGGEDLSTILKNIAAQKTHIPFYMLYFYWMEMLHAVREIHSHGVIHSDLKPANFLKADSGLKLIDFGIASTVQIDMTSVFKTVPEGSCNYISPEALNQECSSDSTKDSAKYKLHFKSDVWSLGCILYQLVYRRTPFHHLHNLWKKLAYIVNPNHTIEYPPADWVPPKIINTMKKCLQYNVKSRPTVDELINEYKSFGCSNCFSTNSFSK